jgi:hypothetical protein
MTSNRHNLAVSLAGLISLWGIGSTTEAGFMSACIDGDAFISAPMDSLAGSSAPREEQRQPVPLPGKVKLPLAYLDAFLGGPSGGGMSTSSSGSGSSPAPAATLAADFSPAPDLQRRLPLRKEPFHPRFMKSRLFRPPRS